MKIGGGGGGGGGAPDPSAKYGLNVITGAIHRTLYHFSEQLFYGTYTKGY